MTSFSHVIKDEQGIHARPAGLLVKELQKFSSQISIQKGEKKADGKKLFTVMALAAKKGDEIIITAEGDDADAACAMAKEFLEKNL